MIILLKNLGKVSELLKNFFKLIVGYYEEITSLNDDFSKMGVSKVVKDHSREKIFLIDQNSINFTEGMRLILFYIDDYVQGIISWYEFFAGLVNAFGELNWFKVLKRKIKIEDAVDLDKVDFNIFKFQIDHTIRSTLPQIKKYFSRLSSKSNVIPEEFTLIYSQNTLEFVKISGKIATEWLKIHDEFLPYVKLLSDENGHSKAIEIVLQLINRLINFADNFYSKVEKLLKFNDARWENFYLEDLWELSDLFSGIKEKLIETFKFRTKSYEYISKCYLRVLTIMWENQDYAMTKLSELLDSEKKFDDIIPSDIHYDNLQFGLMQARVDLEASMQAYERFKENLGVFKVLVGILKSSNMKILHEGISKRLGIQEKYWQKILENLIELQKELNSM